MPNINGIQFSNALSVVEVPTGAPKIDVSPSTQIVPVPTTNIATGVTGITR